ncbi:MAG: putative ATP-grasp-modified RiPP [Pseudonocardiaceae bacterium]
MVEPEDDVPGGPGGRPFGLGFATATVAPVIVDLSGLHYDTDRQLSVDDAGIVVFGKHSTGHCKGPRTFRIAGPLGLRIRKRGLKCRRIAGRSHRSTRMKPRFATLGGVLVAGACTCVGPTAPGICRCGTVRKRSPAGGTARRRTPTFRLSR